jgi:hypothetical protein
MKYNKNKLQVDSKLTLQHNFTLKFNILWILYAQFQST